MRSFWRSAWLAAFLVLFVARPAVAHQKLESSVPAANARLMALPSEILLRFAQAVPATAVGVQLTDAGGRVIPIGPPIGDESLARTFRIAVGGVLRAGDYVVRWSALGADGHPVTGSFTFTILPEAVPAGSLDSLQPGPAGGGPVFPGVAEPAGIAMTVDSPIYAAVRWLNYVAMILLIGAVMFRLVVLPRVDALGPFVSPIAHATARLKLLATVAAIGLIAFAGLRLALQVAALRVSVLPGHAPSIGAALSGAWGTGWHLQVAGAATALAALALPALARVSWHLALAACLGGVAVGSALSGHAVAAPNATMAVTLDALHVLAAGAWIGGIGALIVGGLPAAAFSPDREIRGPTALAMVTAFTPLALSAAAVLVFTGIAASWTQLGSLAALTTSTYGRILMLKVGLVAITAAIGGINWRRLGGKVSTAEGAVLLTRSARAEFGVALAVLAATAVLVALPTPVD